MECVGIECAIIEELVEQVTETAVLESIEVEV